MPDLDTSLVWARWVACGLFVALGVVALDVWFWRAAQARRRCPRRAGDAPGPQPSGSGAERSAGPHETEIRAFEFRLAAQLAALEAARSARGEVARAAVEDATATVDAVTLDFARYMTGVANEARERLGLPRLVLDGCTQAPRDGGRR